MVQTTTLKHRQGPWRLGTGHLERVQHRVRSHLDKGMPQALLFQVDTFAFSPPRVNQRFPSEPLVVPLG